MEVLSESQQSQPGPSSSSSQAQLNSANLNPANLNPANLTTSGSAASFQSPSTVGSVFRPLPLIAPSSVSDSNNNSNNTGLNLSTSGPSSLGSLGTVGVGSLGSSSAAALVGVNVVANVVASLDHHQLHSSHESIHSLHQSQLASQLVNQNSLTNQNSLVNQSSLASQFHQVTNPSAHILQAQASQSASGQQSQSASGQQSQSQLYHQISSFSEPVVKRLRTNPSSCGQQLYQALVPSVGQYSGEVEKLERRLNAVLCCAVCMDLPRCQVFQCTNGHLMCSPCFTHCLADARLKDETATCPSCRCIITRDSCSRNLAVEKAVSELPGSCRFCERELPRSLLHHHELESCEERIVGCTFSRLGCPWKGPFHETGNHESTCPHPCKSGRDILSSLESLDREAKEEKKLYDSIFDLLSFEKITFHDLQFKGYRTEEFIHRLYYETARFTAFNNQWVVKARVNENEKNPSQVCDRRLSYQLVLKSKLQSPLAIHYLILKGPFGDMKVNPRLNRCEFNESTNESPYVNLPLLDSNECNKLLASKAINFRLIMFQMPK